MRPGPVLDHDRDVGLLVALGIDEIPGAAVLVFDRDLRYVLVRGGAVRDNAARAEDLEGRRAPEALPPARWAYLRPLYEEALRGGTTSAEVDSPDGLRHYLIGTAPLRSKSGEVLGGVSVASDVTELRGAQHACRHLPRSLHRRARVQPQLPRMHPGRKLPRSADTP